ncbi:MAG: transcriptional regulator [Myxococcaceae bacterium]|nr:transcriptional regulator [Myxococcaceae bacterium]
MPTFTLHELSCLDAVVSEGSFQAAAVRLGRTHPSVHAAVGSLERQLGVRLLDRSQYRVALTDSGRALMPRVRRVLDHAALLEQDAARLESGEETELDITIGDLCPLEWTTRMLVDFFKSCPGTRLNLRHGAIAGPWQSLLRDEAQLIFHHIEKEELRFESLPLRTIRLLPVAAPGMLPFAAGAHVTPQQMADFTQCILRDSAVDFPERNYHVMPGARRCSVADQATKKALIMAGFAWGHMPEPMIERELAEQSLVSLAGEHFASSEIVLCAARRVGLRHGPVAERLWAYLRTQSRAGLALAQSPTTT